MSNRSASLFRLACIGFTAITGVFGQFENGAVLGSIADPAHGVIPKCAVKLENVQKSVTVSTFSGDKGDYECPNVSVGTYRLSANCSGFKVSVTAPFEVTVSARQRVDLTMQVGAVSETVSVEGAASPLESDSSDRGQVVHRDEVSAIPLNGRAYADLALLVPGVRRSNNATSREGSFNANGLRSGLNNFVMDGIDNNSYATSNQGYSNEVVQPPPDAVQEFRVQTDNYSAEYGRAAGAVVNASIRSGGNEFHGSAWEFLRNTQLNAVGFFKPVGGSPTLVQNQFGGALGGPIR